MKVLHKNTFVQAMETKLNITTILTHMNCNTTKPNPSSDTYTYEQEDAIYHFGWEDATDDFYTHQ